MTTVGTRARRLEDPRLLRGAGRFADDVDVPGQLWMRVVRADVAHAQLHGVDLSAACERDGVHAVLCAADLEEVPYIRLRLGRKEPALAPYLQPVLAGDRIRYVGEPVAVVVADDPYLAEDAAEAVTIDCTPLPSVLGPRPRDGEGRPPLHGESHVVTTIECLDGDTEPVFANAAHVVDVEVEVGRHSAVPLEPRGLLAQYDPSDDRMVIWGATKVPHFNRRLLSEMLGMPEHHISLRPMDAGGGFGARGEFYPEDFLVAYLARRLRRPVKWVEDRAEGLVALNHSRQQVRRLQGAFDADGRLLAIRDAVWHDNGAYLRTHGVLVPELTLSMLAGPYRVGSYAGAAHVTLTNKTPCGTYRGPGRYEGTFARERLLDVAANELGIDRIELRRRNLLCAEDLPVHRGLTVVDHDMLIENGDPRALMDQTLEAAEFERWVAEAEEMRREGRLVGTGIACYMEKSGGGPFEQARLDIDRDGNVRVACGGAQLGQGIETVLSQIVADELGLDPHSVEMVCGDTDRIPYGLGSWASRSTMFSGTAVQRAAVSTAGLARRVAGELLEIDPGDLAIASGRVVPRGTGHPGLSLGEIARACDPLSSARRGDPPGLGATGVADAVPMTYPYGVHLAQVEVDPVTGGTTVLRYFVAYEVGRAINPTLVEGQLIGGVAQGIGGALFEEYRYDEEGQPLATTFMDYLMPTASEMPPVGTSVHEDHPPASNPLRAMGAGEGGSTGVGAVIASAIDDALGRVGAVRAIPVTPERMCGLLDARDAGSGAGGERARAVGAIR